MRPLPVLLLAALAVACAPSEQPHGDTVAADSAAVPAATDSAARSPAGTATPLPTTTPDSGARAPGATGTAAPRATRTTPRTTSATPAGRGTATDTSTGPRIRPPSKAPGGYIIVPNSAHDSLRMAPKPGTTTGTSTRP